MSWRLQARPAHLAAAARQWPLALALGIAFVAAHLILLNAFYAGPPPAPGARILNAFLATGAVVGLCFGILGAFLRLFPAPTPVITLLGGPLLLGPGADLTSAARFRHVWRLRAPVYATESA